MAHKRLIPLADASSQLTLDEKTLRRYISQGILTGYRVGPRAIRLDADEVDALARPIPAAG
jgi:excisionase family DNA binding protein